MTFFVFVPIICYLEDYKGPFWSWFWLV